MAQCPAPFLEFTSPDGGSDFYKTNGEDEFYCERWRCTWQEGQKEFPRAPRQSSRGCFVAIPKLKSDSDQHIDAVSSTAGRRTARRATRLITSGRRWARSRRMAQIAAVHRRRWEARPSGSRLRRECRRNRDASGSGRRKSPHGTRGPVLGRPYAERIMDSCNHVWTVATRVEEPTVRRTKGTTRGNASQVKPEWYVAHYIYPSDLFVPVRLPGGRCATASQRAVRSRSGARRTIRRAR